MSKNLRYSRIILKRTDIPTLSATTAPTTEDHTLQPAWATTDIYKGEFYLNLNDDRLYIRTTNGIREVPLANPSTGPATNDILVYGSAPNPIWTYQQSIPSTGSTSGSSGINGTSGSSGTNGTSGSSGTNGTSGSSGISLSGGTGGNYLSGLTGDVYIPITPNDGDILKYNSGTTKWNNSIEYFIEQLYWSKERQTLRLDLSGSYPSQLLKIEGRPIDIISGDTTISDEFYTCLCYSGLTLTLPPTSGWTSGDDYHGSIFKFKLIQSGSTTINIDSSDIGIFSDVYSTPNSTFITLTRYGEVVTLQSNSDNNLWYII